MIEDTLFRQGLETILNSLEEARLQSIGDVDTPKVCATCYMYEDECCCQAPLYWPLSTVIYKLRAELRSPYGT